MPPLLEPDWVTEDVIRRIFNDGQYYQRAQSGELTTVTKRNSHPDHPPHGEPFCTRSQMVRYYNREGELVAIAHQYLRPDGTLGASGLPDPKRVILEDRIIAVRAKRQKGE